MVQFEEFELKNGLRVVVHPDTTTQMGVLNLMYNVGSRDEHEQKTGFAHLFEHLMFGGSKHVANFDSELQKVGGDNNAFTSPDVTNYYITLPAVNMETAFWVESDRMLHLNLDHKSLEVQRKVVIEEFKQRYLNQPYGDVWLKLRPLAYTMHPYKWATIGKEIQHIEEATLDDVEAFFNKFYSPNNAVLVVGGNVEVKEIERLATKWFEPIPRGDDHLRKLLIEPKQTQKRTLTVNADVPANALYKSYHMCDRLHSDYYATDLLSDIAGRGKSSRLHQKLVQEKQLFTSISSYIMGSFDPGMCVVNGMLRDGISFDEAEQGIDTVLQEIQNETITEDELFKVKNQAESTIEFGRVEILERCMGLAYGAIVGNTNQLNEEPASIQEVTLAQINRIAQEILRNENSSTLYYQSN